MAAEPWWKSAVVDQIYSSFAETDGSPEERARAQRQYREERWAG